jgi:hypothetical protein
MQTIPAIFAYSTESSAKDFQPELIVDAPENVFAPYGFDNNDNSQIVIYGNLIDTCHKTGPIQMRVDQSRKVILLRNQIYYYPGCWCADVLTPYTQTINLGVLKTGAYEVVVEKSDGSMEKVASFPVTASMSSSPDDFLYAPVDHVHFNKKSGDSPNEVTLTGTFRNTCMKLRDIKVNYRPNHVIEILPIAEMADKNCEKAEKPFKASIPLKANSGRALIHVRSLNGQSINQVVELD